VDVRRVPHSGPPTHAMEIMSRCEDGTVKFLWVTGTNPAVSLPQLQRIRSLYGQDRLFLVVSDAFPTETTDLADVVLPAALWGEKTGCYTNADRTVHLSEKAVEPPEEARSDFETLLDYAARMELKNKDGDPLITWSAPQDAWEAFTALTRQRVCDQSALTYEKLRDADGIQWPCTEEAPHGTERLYADHHFATAADECEDYGHDLATGTQKGPDDYSVHDPYGRAVIKAAHYVSPQQQTDADFPLRLTTGRRVHHWHTRTKTARAPQLDHAAPDSYVQLNEEDAAQLHVREGELVRVRSRWGEIEATATVGGVRAGTVFIPFHYGYFDQPEDGPRRRAANELTHTEWDPVSKQPVYKATPVRVEKAASADTADTATAGGTPL
jgi:ferredoxin-nitrate reductase